MHNSYVITRWDLKANRTVTGKLVREKIGPPGVRVPCVPQHLTLGPGVRGAHGIMTPDQNFRKTRIARDILEIRFLGISQ